MAGTSGRDWLDPTRLYNPKVPAGRLLYVWGGWIYPLLWIFAISIGAMVLEGMMGYYDTSPILDILTVPVELACIVVAILMVLRRLRDLETTGWAILVMFVPVVNFLFSLYLIFAPGKRGKLVGVPASEAVITVEPVAPTVERQLTPPVAAIPAPAPATPSLASVEKPRRASTCNRCGSPLDPAARYCVVCGAPKEG
jgi:uncharacterized membrane protein YhaH (DUF805 family)